MNNTDLSSARFLAIRQVLGYLVSPPCAELELFLNLFSNRTLKQGEYFLQAGYNSIELAFVNAGLLRFFYRSEDGKEFNKSFIPENQFAAA